jgi:PleD family two-component response regulator
MLRELENVLKTEFSEFKKRILVIDDNEFPGGLLRRKLQRHEYGVISVVDEFNMVEHAFEHAPDLILLDIELSLCNGGTIYKNFKKYRKKIWKQRSEKTRLR